jgi:RES domain-containing protein
MDDDLALQFVGFREEFVRVAESVYIDQASYDFPRYLRDTLHYNQRGGGRYNPPGEFGALYTAGDEATAWAELYARYQREGFTGLPPRMGLIRLAIESGKYVDFNDPDARDAWDVDRDTLQADDPTDAQKEACWQLGRDVRAVADFLRAPSARADGDNIPIFVEGRRDPELKMALIAVDTRRESPFAFRQHARESWD